MARSTEAPNKGKRWYARHDDLLKTELPPDSIFVEENAFVLKRRGRADVSAAKQTSNKPITDLVGIALSGGGIRSATFCLGVAQALNRHGVINRADYLSTVSGGGYFGSSLTTTLTAGAGDFCYGGGDSANGVKERTEISSSDIRDTREVGHLRNYSNYLIPNGFGDLMRSAAVIARGLAANAMFVIWLIFLSAFLTALFNPTKASLSVPDILGFEFHAITSNFAFTLMAAALLFILLFFWALNRSEGSRSIKDDTMGGASSWFGAGLLAVAVIAFLELQPFVLKSFFATKELARLNPNVSTGSWFTQIGLLLAPIAAFVTFFRENLKGVITNSYFSKTYSAALSRLLAKAVLWMGALALPLLIWALYLNLSYWAIADTTASRDHIAATDFAHSAGWMQWLLAAHVPPNLAWLPYLVIGALAFLLSYLLKPNAYSLHHLYRDRLAKAFLFKPYPKDKMTNDPSEATAQEKDSTHASSQTGTAFDPEPFSPSLVELIQGSQAPYQLINTAVNVRSGSDANRRGRNADFFLFSPNFVGSPATGYVSTAEFETWDSHLAGTKDEFRKKLDLATVLAISGAAASSNMGARTIRALAPTLALLNIRLGYWLLNPRNISVDQASEPPRKSRNWSKFFLPAEMFGLMNEYDNYVYLTDGGHIENLGIYELLRRRCRLIIAVDAEADPQMRFGSFITLQIYARIDLGIHIELPFQEIRKSMMAARRAASFATMGRGATEQGAGVDQEMQVKPDAPHVAVGRIDYGGNVFGTLIYIKASMTGDENDYLRDYQRRNPLFPHESTGDQFFTEEQFEVYRALGFHIADRFFSGRDCAIVARRGDTRGSGLRPVQKPEPVLATVHSQQDEHMQQIRSMLPVHSESKQRLTTPLNRSAGKRAALASVDEAASKFDSRYQKEQAMAKGASKPKKETRKPKKDAKKPPAPAAKPTIKAK